MIPTRFTPCLWRAASRATLVWLLSAASAQAAVPARCAVRSALAVASIKLSTAVAQTPKKVRPLRKAKCRARVSANVLVPRLGHAVARRPLAGAIVQGDEAAHDGARDSLVPSFSSLGFISTGGDASPSSRPFSPQSPRGPPLSA